MILKSNKLNSNFSFYFIKCKLHCIIFYRGKDKLWIQDSLKYNSPFTSICWITALIIFICGFTLIIISFINDELWYLFDDGILLLVLLTINLATVLWDNKLRHEEMFIKLDHVMKKLNCKKIKL